MHAYSWGWTEWVLLKKWEVRDILCIWDKPTAWDRRAVQWYLFASCCMLQSGWLREKCHSKPQGLANHKSQTAVYNRTEQLSRAGSTSAPGISRTSGKPTTFIQTLQPRMCFRDNVLVFQMFQPRKPRRPFPPSGRWLMGKPIFSVETGFF